MPGDISVFDGEYDIVNPMSIPTTKSSVIRLRSYDDDPMNIASMHWDNDKVINADHYGEVTNFNFRTAGTEYEKQFRYSNLDFDGVCMDSGAQVSVCGKRQALAYCKQMQIPFTVRPSSMRFRFGDMMDQSIGIMKFRFPCPHGGSIDIDIDIVDIDIPLLLGLLELRHHKLLVNYFTNTLENKSLLWTAPLFNKYGHLYWTFDTCESFYSRAEIERLHKHFFHPSSRKLYNLVKRSELGQATADLRQLIEDVTNACLQCKECSSKPLRFCASILDDEVVCLQPRIGSRLSLGEWCTGSTCRKHPHFVSERFLCQEQDT